jgi:hypothetical protein
VRGSRTAGKFPVNVIEARQHWLAGRNLLDEEEAGEAFAAGWNAAIALSGGDASMSTEARAMILGLSYKIDCLQAELDDARGEEAVCTCAVGCLICPLSDPI